MVLSSGRLLDEGDGTQGVRAVGITGLDAAAEGVGRAYLMKWPQMPPFFTGKGGGRWWRTRAGPAGDVERREVRDGDCVWPLPSSAEKSVMSSFTTRGSPRVVVGPVDRRAAREPVVERLLGRADHAPGLRVDAGRRAGRRRRIRAIAGRVDLERRLAAVDDRPLKSAAPEPSHATALVRLPPVSRRTTVSLCAIREAPLEANGDSEGLRARREGVAPVVGADDVSASSFTGPDDSSAPL